MSNRNFDSRVIIQRLQAQNYARNLYNNNVNSRALINNPQTTDGNASVYNTFHTGSETMYFRGLLGGGETISIGGTIMQAQVIESTVIPPPTIPSNLMVINILANNGDTMTLPFYGISSINVNWGPTSITYGPDVTPSYTYSNSGYYPITIGGAANSFGNAAYTGSNLISSVSQWGTLGISSLSFAFFDASNLVAVPSTIPSSVTNLYGMFYNAHAFNDANVSLWNTSSVTDMNNMFSNATAFNSSINWTSTSNVRDMTSMFQQATAFNQSTNNWNTSSVLNMQYMFSGATTFVQDISGWSTSNIANPNAENMFCNCPMSTFAYASYRPHIAYTPWISSCS